jgi:PilZ domain
MEAVKWEADTVEAAERRRHDRVAGPFDGRRVGLLHTPVRLYDLSEGGCFINSLHEQQPGIAVVLEIDLPAEGWIRVKCQTLYAKPGFGFAMRFVELTEEISTRLERGLKKIREGEDNWIIG